MKPETETAIRNLLAKDPTVKAVFIEKAIDLLRGRDETVPHVIRRKDILKLLQISRRTLDYYLEKGYLDRVYGGGTRALGVSRDSYLRFIERRIVSRETNQRPQTGVSRSSRP